MENATTLVNVAAAAEVERRELAAASSCVCLCHLPAIRMLR